MSFEYVNHSIEVVQAIDAGRLGEARLGACANEGVHSRFYPIGAMSTADGLTLGLKVPQPSRAIRSLGDGRLEAELPVVSLLTDKMPALSDLVPAFLGKIMVAGKSLAVITEDATVGGSRPIQPTGISEALRREMTTVFCSGDQLLHEVFSYTALAERTAFEVGGEERLLDFLPSPLQPKFAKLFGLLAHREYVRKNRQHLAVELPPDAPLAQDLMAL